MKVRLWKLGHINKEDPTKSMFPTKKSIDILRSILSEAAKSETGEFDFVWGPDLQLELVDIEDELNLVQVDEETYKVIKKEN